MIALSVNLNKIALIRNSRDTTNPDVVEHARMALQAGADGITVHPRPDQRHIRASDCLQLAEMLQREYPDVEFNIEGNPFTRFRKSKRIGVSDYPGFMALVEAIRPAQCTLVPDTDAQLTSDCGFDLKIDGDRVKPLIDQLHAMAVRVSLFMDPVPEQITLAAELGADRIELYTEPYADAVKAGQQIDSIWRQYYEATAQATELGLGVNAGHDLDLYNLPQFAKIPGILEVSIGHALIADAIRIGFINAIVAYQDILKNPSDATQ